MSWEEQILKKIEIRDEIERKDLVYLRAFDELIVRATNAERLLSSATPDEADLPAVEPHSKPKSKSDTYDISPGEGRKLNEENLALKAANSKLTEKLNSLDFENESKRAKIRSLEQADQKNLKLIESLRHKINDLKLEIREKNKSIEIVNDEVLSNSIQNNVLQNRVKELTVENEGLIKRWIDKVKMDAERMNEVNEMLEERWKVNEASSKSNVNDGE